MPCRWSVRIAKAQLPIDPRESPSARYRANTPARKSSAVPSDSNLFLHCSLANLRVAGNRCGAILLLPRVRIRHTMSTRSETTGLVLLVAFMILMRAMSSSSPTRRFGSWLAIVVFALNALWPLMSLANPGVNQAWMEICTQSGKKFLPLGDKAGDEDGGTGIKVPQCPLCSAGSSFDWVLPPATAPLASTALLDARYSACFVSPTRPAIYEPAHPRAPPQLS